MGQYFSNEELKSNITKYKTIIFDKQFWFNTDNGVFSKEKLDFGTRTLLENLPLKELKGDILEVGCGYGVVPIILSKVCCANYEGVDVNRRALHLANKNILENRCEGVCFYESDCFTDVRKEKYDYIISNPPIRAGKEVVYRIVMGARDYLKEEGSLFIVIRKDQGAKSLLKDLETVYSTIVIAKNKGFFVIRCNLR